MLGTLFHSSAARLPDKPALICEKESVTYRDLDASVTQLARWFRQQGLQSGDRVAIHSLNSIPTVQLVLACFRAGMVVLPLNARLKAAEVAYVLDHARPRIYFCQPQLAAIAEIARAGLAEQPQFYTALPDLETGDADELPAIDEHAPALVLYTSGTTARPRGVLHTHRTIHECARLMKYFDLGEPDTLLLITSLMHVSGLVLQLVPALISGATVVLVPAFQAAAVLDAGERHGCTWSGALPTMLQFLVEEQTARPRRIPFRTFIGGGDTVPLSLNRRFEELFGIPVLDVFGMTENVPLCGNLKDTRRPGSIGRPMEGVEARVLGLTGRELGDGEIGELAVRTPGNFIRYWNDPVETAATLQGGWLLTGDLVRRDRDGYFWFEGRKKQIIVRGGANIAPQEVEAALYQHPAVLEAGVIGLPDPVHGERVVAFVTVRAGHSPGEQELREFARERLSDHKVPERIEFLGSLPIGPTGKVLRRALKEMAMGRTAAR
jgi:long-chain acyl-CoA synthetase